ncbi:transcriptional repressor LexA [Aphanothece sacrum]|uniref:LexA repressor n=1 Tax=Aphanothece sacrum FPU1 TaxID=1920663 RepID=A0A401ILF8_APHSA|nr:transcriptional repressor LexA [Aphanothece sacrum]GBF82071.1 LexA repressor [Aphanothece sacrum FPU1]GBF85005.1 LexA repressor [Aphanothece sacrum FPU3]
MESLTPAQQELYDWLVLYINEKQHAPSIRQMMKAMNLRSPAPVQSRLERLRNKGYIDWTEGKARTLRILRPQPQGLTISGEITPGGLVEPFAEDPEKIDLAPIFKLDNHYALRVKGDSMIEDLITDGDLAILRSLAADEVVTDGDIVSAIIEGVGTTIKRFYQEGETVTLKASNPNHPPIEVNISQVEIQGVFVGVWRGYKMESKVINS